MSEKGLGLPTYEIKPKKNPHPRDTHNQFSIKTLLSKLYSQNRSIKSVLFFFYLTRCVCVCLFTAPASVCVPDVIGALAQCLDSKAKKTKKVKWKYSRCTTYCSTPQQHPVSSFLHSQSARAHMDSRHNHIFVKISFFWAKIHFFSEISG